MSDETDSAEYDPTDPTPPEREPPRRSTAPQSQYTGGQVAFGVVVLVGGLLVVVGLTLALA
jgi:hypothetical protein